MKNKFLIISIAVLSMILLCVCIYIMLTPVQQPQKPVEPDPFPENSIHTAEGLGIERKTTKIPKRLVIRNYTDGLPTSINVLEKVSFKVLTKDSKNYMLFVPYQTGGTLTITELMRDDFLEEYVPNEERVILKEEIGENYALILQYDRPEVAKYEVKITQGDDTVTYRIYAPAGAKIPSKEEFAADKKKEEPDEVIYQTTNFGGQVTYVAPSVYTSNEEDTIEE